MRRRTLQSYGYVRRRDREEDIIMVAEIEIQRKKKRGRPKKRSIDTVKDEILKCGLSDEDVDNRISSLSDSTWCQAKPPPILDHSVLGEKVRDKSL